MPPDLPGSLRPPTGQADGFEKLLIVDDRRIGIFDDRQKKVGQQVGGDIFYLFDGSPVLPAQLFEDDRQ